MSDVTQILSQIEQGDPSAPEQLLPLVYEELRKLAIDEALSSLTVQHPALEYNGNYCFLSFSRRPLS